MCFWNAPWINVEASSMFVAIVSHAPSQWAQNEIIMSSWRQNNVVTLFWRQNDIIFASCVLWVLVLKQVQLTHWGWVMHIWVDKLMPPFHWATIWCRPLPIWGPTLERQQSAKWAVLIFLLRCNHARYAANTIKIRLIHDVLTTQQPI